MGETTETTSENGTETTTETNAEPTTGVDDVATAKAEAEKWKNLSRKNEAELRKAQSALEKAQQGSMTDLEKAVAEAKNQAKAEATAEFLRSSVADKVAVAAAGKLADPQDAAALIGDLDRFIVSGAIDTTAIGAAINELVERKPYLAVNAPPPIPGRGAGEGGARGGSTTTTKDPLVSEIERMVGGSPR